MKKFVFLIAKPLNNSNKIVNIHIWQTSITKLGKLFKTINELGSIQNERIVRLLTKLLVGL